MPTGYTSIIEDRPDCTFADYAKRCARAFGALVCLRDESLDAPLPEKMVPSDYHEREITKAREAYVKYERASEADLRAEIAAERARVQEINANFLEEHARHGAAYARIRSEVVNWTPPSPDHDRLKEFMLEQIDLCWRPDSTPYQAPMPPESVSEYRAQKLAAVERDLQYHDAEWAKECERTRERNAWLQALLRSLPK